MLKTSTDETLLTLKGIIATQKKQIKQLKSKLAMSTSTFLNIVGNHLDGVVIIDQKRMVVYTNYAAINLFDRNIADLLGEPLDFNFTLTNDTNETLSKIHIPKADGSKATAEVSIFNTEWNNQPAYVVGFRDITAQTKHKDALEYSATHDYLTDLTNRVDFEKQIEHAIHEASFNDQHIAVLYLDLDNFKQINDTLGHAAGDLLLKDVSTALQHTIRRIDTVARMGGDEFAVLVRYLRKPEYAVAISRSILNTLGNVFNLEGNPVHINASIGIAVYPVDGVTAAELIKNADAAMYIAKTPGKNKYQLFSKS